MGRVKTQTIKTAIESAILLLRVDDVVSGVSKKKDGVGGNQSAGAPPTFPHSSMMCPNSSLCRRESGAPATGVRRGTVRRRDGKLARSCRVNKKFCFAQFATRVFLRVFLRVGLGAMGAAAAAW